MIKEIKFRGKCLFTGMLVYGGYYFVDKESKRRHYIVDSSNNKFTVVGETVSQYTGLKDRNGKEIYFGDSVKAPSGLLLKVLWHDEEMRIMLLNKETLYNFNVGLYEVL